MVWRIVPPGGGQLPPKRLIKSLIDKRSRRVKMAIPFESRPSILINGINDLYTLGQHNRA